MGRTGKEGAGALLEGGEKWVVDKGRGAERKIRERGESERESERERERKGAERKSESEARMRES